MNILNLFRRNPKADLGLTDNIALELLRAQLAKWCDEPVYLIETRLWTANYVTPGRFAGSNDDLRRVKIVGRPVAFGEPATPGLYHPDALPRVEAEITFYSGEVSVYSWQFHEMTLHTQRWGRRSMSAKYAAHELPELAELSKRLFDYRNGNEIKRQAPSDHVRAPRSFNAPTS